MASNPPPSRKSHLWPPRPSRVLAIVVVSLLVLALGVVCFHERDRPAVADMRWPDGVEESAAGLLAEARLDHVEERRRVRDAVKIAQQRIDHFLFKDHYNGVKTSESFEVNSRGVEIFSKSWFPHNSRLKGLVFLFHGYGDTITFFFEGIARKIASSGYGVFGMDYPGFGLSEGLHGYIPSFDRLVDDVIEHFGKIRANTVYQGLPRFLFGQSMGGAVALKAHFKQPDDWDGAILVAPMCKIADDVIPPWPLLQTLIFLAKIFPKEKLVPERNLAELAFREEKKREQTSYNAIAYKDNPRLRTALEMLLATQEIERRLEEVSLPLLILHGESDMVTDPQVSKLLYEKARTDDKKIILYKDAYHSILEGEPDDTIRQALNDITSWLDAHTNQKFSY